VGQDGPVTRIGILLAAVAIVVTGAVAPTPAMARAAATSAAPCPADTITAEVAPRARYVSDRLRLVGYSPGATAGILEPGCLSLTHGAVVAGSRRGITWSHSAGVGTL
jgi:hypothetical protein